MGVNDLSKVTTQQCPSGKLGPHCLYCKSHARYQLRHYATLVYIVAENKTPDKNLS